MNLNIFKCKVDGIGTQKVLWRFFQSLILKVSSLAIYLMDYDDCFSVEVWNQFLLKRPCYTKLCNIFFHLKAVEGPFGNLGISISALALALTSASRKFYFCLTKCFMKNKTFMWNTLKYSFLHLVMRHQYPSVTITHFSTISYHISTKIPK